MTPLVQTLESMAKYIPIGSIHTFPSGESFVMCVVDDELRWCAFDTTAQNHVVAGLSDIVDLNNPEFVEEEIDLNELNDDTNMAFDAAQQRDDGGSFQDMIRRTIQSSVTRMATQGGGGGGPVEDDDLEDGEITEQ